MQSVNCIFFQLRWLESNLRSSPNSTLIIGLIVIGLLGYLTFACAGGDANGNSFCGQNGVSSLIIAALVCAFLYFIYKRFTPPRTQPDQPHEDGETEKFIEATVPPFDQIIQAAPVGYANV